MSAAPQSFSDLPKPPSGLAVLESLHAEEEPWLMNGAFVPTANRDLLSGNRAAIVYGGPGSGKTALRMALERSTKKFVVSWRPELAANILDEGTAAIEREMDRVLGACAEKLVSQLPARWERFSCTGDWVRGILLTIIQRYFPGGLNSPEFEFIQNKLSPHIAQQLRDMLKAMPQSVLKADAPHRAVIDHLVKALGSLGWEGIWVLVDGLEGEAAVQQEALTATLTLFLSSLFLFDDQRCSYKLFLPANLQPLLQQTTAIQRSRVTENHMRWSEAELRAVVTRRLALARGVKDISINSVFSEQRIWSWLHRCGGGNPRGWLEYFRPILTDFINLKDGKAPLTESEWSDARSRSIVRFSFDPQTDNLLVGARKIEDISPEGLAILRYLYQHSNVFCSKESIYLHAYLSMQAGDVSGGALQPKPLPKDYEDVINTAVWRLRKMIEPDPKSPIFIQSQRERGIKLNTEQQ